MKKLILGIDTSNYTTSLALVSGGVILKNVRRLLPVKEGVCGLRQSDAVFLHTKALPELAHELFESEAYTPGELAAVAVSDKPRDADGSYMPCFLAGVSFAEAVALSCGVPLYRFSHQSGHIMAGIASCAEGLGGTLDRAERFLSFHVSGGTTEALLVEKSGGSFSYTIIGGTNDASAGQIIDRAGVFAGLPFPCGRALDECAADAAKKLPRCVSMNGAYFSFSGLQNKFESYLTHGEALADSAAFLFDSIGEALSRSTDAARARFGAELPVLYAGGVMSNTHIRARLSAKENVFFASLELSSDNACGTALLGERQYTESQAGRNGETV